MTQTHIPSFTDFFLMKTQEWKDCYAYRNIGIRGSNAKYETGMKELKTILKTKCIWGCWQSSIWRFGDQWSTCGLFWAHRYQLEQNCILQSIKPVGETACWPFFNVFVWVCWQSSTWRRCGWVPTAPSVTSWAAQCSASPSSARWFPVLFPAGPSPSSSAVTPSATRYCHVWGFFCGKLMSAGCMFSLPVAHSRVHLLR